MTNSEHRMRTERLRAVNELIIFISSAGRRFFQHNGRVSQVEMDHRYRLWLNDCWGHRIYLHYCYQTWRFSSGGTMWSLIQAFRCYIQNGVQLRYGLGPWPDWICGGDLWGYGDDMEKVRERATELGIYDQKLRKEEA